MEGLDAGGNGGIGGRGILGPAPGTEIGLAGVPAPTATTAPVADGSTGKSQTPLPARLRVGARGVLTPTTEDRERAKAGLKGGGSRDRDSSPESEASFFTRGDGGTKESVSRETTPAETEDNDGGADER